ncbi:PLP-dependent aminotransferase family protein [Sphingomonas sp. RB56-2]|uniref:PLP-dependent aminotransferase family protein n=1 Tax=Sphingomonas brevis TaxID=2908206 RepID=A0ABT0S6F9_9SPHN|nr:PLP-dependent aminotransferase family protein [Sphingomonas brevis]MCL6739716.1 PLP-dependent aminotransferase family protein [Sphingomonas brevis]
MASRKIGASSLSRLMGGWHADAMRGPAYRQIRQALRLLILDGRLPIGVRLPGERNLADALDVSRTTVAAAYAELRDLGFVFSRHGSGSITRLPREQGNGPDQLQATAEIDFSIAALPAPSHVHAAYAEALAELPRHLPGIGYEPAGIADLRSAIAERYARSGVPTDPDQILVTQGAQQGLVLLLSLLARPGDPVVIDHPTYSKAIEAIRAASCQPIPVNLPQSGWDAEQYRSAMAQTGSRLSYLLPDFHNPTGRLMGAECRQKIAAVAASQRGHLIVDETMIDLWLDVPRPTSMAAFDRGDHVITLGSMGKSFWGGLRMGWVRASHDIIAALAASRAANDMGSPILEQLAATALLRRPDDILDERRQLIREQRDHLLKLVGEQLPDWRFERPPGGLCAWAELPRPLSSALAVAAHDLGIRIAPGGKYGIDGAFERFVRLPYALPKPVLSDVVERLAQAWREVAAGGHSSSAPAEPRLTEAI